jgi:hypothetical protein
MAKPRIPLPKQVEQVHQAESQYDRRQEKRVSLDEVYSDPANQPSPEYMRRLKIMQAQAINESTKERRTAIFFYKEVPYTCHLVRDCPNNDECSDWYIEELTPEITNEGLYREVTGEAIRVATEAEKNEMGGAE